MWNRQCQMKWLNRIVHINYVQWLMLFYLLSKSCVFNPFFCSVFVNNFVFAHIRMGGFQCDSIAKIKDEHWTYSTVVLILDMLNVCKAAIYTSIIICFVATTLSDCKSSIFVYFWIQYISVKYYYAFYKRIEFSALAKSSFFSYIYESHNPRRHLWYKEFWACWILSTMTHMQFYYNIYVSTNAQFFSVTFFMSELNLK